MEEFLIFLIIFAIAMGQAWSRSQKKRKEYEQKRKAQPVARGVYEKPPQSEKMEVKETKKTFRGTKTRVEPVAGEAKKAPKKVKKEEEAFPSKEKEAVSGKELLPQRETVKRKKKSKRPFDLELDEAAKGVIWMEVLSPPRAKNPHPFYRNRTF